MQSFVISNPPPSQIQSKLPLPFPLLQSMFNQLPSHQKSEARYQELAQKNIHIIEQHLCQLLQNCGSTITNGKNFLPPTVIFNQFLQVVRAYPMNGNMYANMMLGEGEKMANMSNNNNELVRKLFELIAHSHSQNYQCIPVPANFYAIVEKQHQKLFTEQNLFAVEEKELEEMIKVEKQAQILKEQLKAANLTANKKPQKQFSNKRDQINNKMISIGQSSSNTGTVYETFSSSLYQQLSFYQFHTLNHFYSTITLQHISMLQKFPYLQSGKDALQMAINELKMKCQVAPQFSMIFDEVIKELNFGLQCYCSSEGSTGKYYEVQSWIIIMVHIYKCLGDSYNSFRRRVLKLIFTSLSNQEISNTIEILRWLENNRIQVLNLNGNYDELQSQASYQLLETHKNRESILKNHNPEKIPRLRMRLLSDKQKPRRKTVNIWVSGFLSEDMDKQSQWGELIDTMPDSEVYGLQWESDTIKNLVKFLFSSGKDLLTASKMKEELKRKFKDNPFNPAFEVAQYSGRYLAELVVALFPQQFINIAGYSLGSELIKSFLERMIERGRQGQISNIYMMGGVTEVHELREIMKLSNSPLSLYNCYTGNDMVLKHVLPMSKPGIEPIGLLEVGEIDGHEIVNIDCSKFISGHLAYMTNFEVVGKVVEMNEE